jgi:glycosyltransferase involved in cell wall biosynthesis
MNAEELKTKKISILAHGAGTGNAEELRDWLIEKKTKEIVYITFPFGASTQKEITVEIYRDGKPVRTFRSLVRFKNPVLFSYLKDFIYALVYCLRFCGSSDVLVGSDNLLTLAAVWMKKHSKIGKVVYYMIDYTPVRYSNAAMNNLYYSMDRAAAYGSDVVWPLDPRTIEGRFEDKKLDPKRVHWYAVPYGNHASVFKLPQKVKKNSVCYLGGLLKNKGAELFIPIAEELIRRKTDFRFVIIGGGPYREELESEIKRKKLVKWIDVKGYIKDNDEVQKVLSNCGVALAPYFPEDKNNFTYYADAGKLKSYLGCGLPIVLTDVPPFAKTLAKKGAGLIAKYDAVDFADKIKKVFSTQSGFRMKAVALGEEFDWDLILTKAFGKL